MVIMRELRGQGQPTAKGQSGAYGPMYEVVLLWRWCCRSCGARCGCLCGVDTVRVVDIVVGTTSLLLWSCLQPSYWEAVPRWGSCLPVSYAALCPR